MLKYDSSYAFFKKSQPLITPETFLFQWLKLLPHVDAKYDAMIWNMYTKSQNRPTF